jgi:riboflavin synthase
VFTGIIQALGTVRRVTPKGPDTLLALATPWPATELNIGDSVAVNGVCLTVTTRQDREFAAFVSAETLDKTNLKFLKTGHPINLEKALRPTDLLSGHLVLGHVDGLGKIREKTARADSLVIGVEVAEAISRYIVIKGSIAIDGISLTVNSCEKTLFYVNIIPHTAQVTTLKSRQKGDQVNIETDILGKYVEKLLQPHSGMSTDFLQKHGFIK